MKKKMEQERKEEKFMLEYKKKLSKMNVQQLSCEWDRVTDKFKNRKKKN